MMAYKKHFVRIREDFIPNSDTRKSTAKTKAKVFLSD